MEAAVEGLKGRAEGLEQVTAPDGPTVRRQVIAVDELVANEQGGVPAQDEQARAPGRGKAVPVPLGGLGKVEAGLDGLKSRVERGRFRRLTGRPCASGSSRRRAWRRPRKARRLRRERARAVLADVGNHIDAAKGPFLGQQFGRMPGALGPWLGTR